MADTNIYATLHYIDPLRNATLHFKCASKGCEKQASNDHKIETIIGQFEGHPATRKVELYFCHGCYIDVKTILYSNLSQSVISGLEYKTELERRRLEIAQSLKETPLAIIPSEEVQ